MGVPPRAFVSGTFSSEPVLNLNRERQFMPLYQT
jgi:hypothetical protein